ncbi:hypothetical protein F4861DRAFT_451509 [Xylaria intraflava]|nr:hypothetical protein F4861DRAFT_451509 [Xylaria intraflava]
MSSHCIGDPARGFIDSGSELMMLAEGAKQANGANQVSGDAQATMSTTPATDATPTPVVSSSASSQRTATLVDSETSDNSQPSDQNMMKPDDACPGLPAAPQPAHCNQRPQFPPAYLLRREISPSEYRRPAPVDYFRPHSEISYDGPEDPEDPERGCCSWPSSAACLECMEGSGRTSHVKGIACVMILLTIIFVVVLVLSLVSKKH